MAVSTDQNDQGDQTVNGTDQGQIGSDANGKPVRYINRGNGQLIATPQRVTGTDPVTQKPSYADDPDPNRRPFVVDATGFSAKPKDPSGTRTVTMNGPQGNGIYAYQFDSQGNVVKDQNGNPAMQFLGSKVTAGKGVLADGSFVQKDGNGNLVAVGRMAAPSSSPTATATAARLRP